jgi:hypothetical protein
LAQHPKVFNKLFVNMVKAGEIGGVLEVVLKRLAEFMEKAEKIKGKVVAAMFYPAAVMVVAVAILALLMIVVVPKFKSIFADLLGGDAGMPVLAAADGRVVYAGSGLRGYGNLVIVKHNNTYLTAYAHNQKLLVREDQAVRRGQPIAEMGSSDADRVKLHFEVRRMGKPVDPVQLLPGRP